MEIYRLNPDNIEKTMERLKILFGEATGRRISFRHFFNKNFNDETEFSKGITVLSKDTEPYVFIWVIDPKVKLSNPDTQRAWLNFKENDDQGDSISQGNLIGFINDSHLFYQQGNHLRELKFTNE